MENKDINDIQDEISQSLTKLIFGIIIIWFVLAFAGGMIGLFNRVNEPPIYLGLFLLVPIIGFTLAYSFSTRIQHIANGIPLWLITIAHVWRFVGIFFVVSAIVHVLPPQFGYPEGLGDAIAAFFCIPLAFAIRKKNRSTGLRTAFIVWNVYGMIDLISAISLGILYSPGPSGILRTDISTAIMTTFPVSLIPTFFVPLFILIHMLGLRRNRELAPDKTHTEPGYVPLSSSVMKSEGQ